MKIVVLDAHVTNPGDMSWEPMKEAGELIVYERTSFEESELIAERIGDAEIAVTSKTPISRDTLDKCGNLRLIAMLSTGYNVVDHKYAKEKGIPVVNVPDYGTKIVGQYAVGLLLEICAHYSYHDKTVKEGRWQKCKDWAYWDYPVIELCGKTAGIIGLGRIGRAISMGLKGFGMNVLACDVNESEEGRRLADYVELNELLKKSDVIFLACPLLPETRNIVNKKNIMKMKHGVIIINNSRGGLVAEQDLADALNGGKVYAAGLDVVSTEPIRKANPLLAAKNCIITPHISWAGKEARQRIMDTTLDNVKAFMNGSPQNIVNP